MFGSWLQTTSQPKVLNLEVCFIGLVVVSTKKNRKNVWRCNSTIRALKLIIMLDVVKEESGKLPTWKIEK